MSGPADVDGRLDYGSWTLKLGIVIGAAQDLSQTNPHHRPKRRAEAKAKLDAMLDLLDRDWKARDAALTSAMELLAEVDRAAIGADDTERALREKVHAAVEAWRAAQ